MFGWLRDALADTSPSPSHRHLMIPSPFFRQQQQQENHKKKEISSSSEGDDDGADDESNDNSFYHNPYHSSGQMNYIDVAQQQYTNENTYPTYLARQQTPSATNQSLDEQIQTKLLSLQHRGAQYQTYSSRNETLPTPDTSVIPDINGEENNTHEEGDNDEISMYYPGQYPNLDENFDFASVVLWYRNVMQSVKKFM